MPENGVTTPTLDGGQNDVVQTTNTAFTLVARNKKAAKMWEDAQNSSRYIPGQLAWQDPSKVLGENVEKGSSVQKADSEPALRFLFDQKPKDYAKGFLLGSKDETCDVVLGSFPDIDPEMVAFTYNEQNELIMIVASIQHITVEFNDQPAASRQQFSWILPRGQKMIRVTVAKGVAHELVFDVVLPPYDPDSIDEYHNNCKPFVIPRVGETLKAEALSVGNTAARVQGGVAFQQASPFYLRKEKLGNGSFGVVRKVQRMPDGKMFAAKAVNMPDSTDRDSAAKRFESDKAFKEEAEKADKAYKKQVEKVEKAFKKEVEILKLVSKPTHDNIVQFVDEWYGDQTPSIILEYMPGGTLQAQLKQMHKENVQMEPGEIKNIAHQLVKGVEFIHDKGIVHQDIKPGNILRKSRDQYVLADFGCAGQMGSVLGGRGTRKYMAPESEKDKSYSFEADVWSLGVVILNCLDALPMEEGVPRPEWCEHLRQKVIDYHSLVEKYSEETLEIQTQAVQLILLVQRYMLQLNPADRLSAKRCLQDFPFLWGQGIPEGPSRVEEVGDSVSSSSTSSTSKALKDELSKALKADQGSHSDPPAKSSPNIEVPKLHETPIENIPSGLSTPEGEANAPFLPGVGDKRKRGDRSLATDNGDKETIVPPLSPRNDRPPTDVGPSSDVRDQKRSKQSATGNHTPPQQTGAPSRSTQAAGIPAEGAAQPPSEEH